MATQQISTAEADTGEVSPEEAKHNEEMSALADGKEAPKEQHQRPDNIPEKFWNAETGETDVEGLAKSYSELEKINSSKPKLDGDGKEVDPNKDEGESKEEPDGKEAPKDNEENTGVDGVPVQDYIESLQTSYDENGELSQDQYKHLEENYGYDAQFVDNYIAGQQALVNNAKNAAFEVVGGEDNFNAMSEWSKTGMTAEERAVINEALSSVDTTKIKMAMESLKTSYESKYGKHPNLLNGGGSGSDGSAYQSYQQAMADMSKPEYKNDPAFRKQVEDKMARSSI